MPLPDSPARSTVTIPTELPRLPSCQFQFQGLRFQNYFSGAKKIRRISKLIILRLKIIGKLDTASTQSLHSLYTVSTQSLHSLCTVSTQSLHSLYTVSTQSVHRIYTVSTQDLHSLYTGSTQSLHRIYPLPVFRKFKVNSVIILKLSKLKNALDLF